MAKTIKKIREEVGYAMSDTSPSWGYRITKVLSILGLDYGDAAETNAGMRSAFAQELSFLIQYGVKDEHDRWAQRDVDVIMEAIERRKEIEARFKSMPPK